MYGVIDALMISTKSKVYVLGCTGNHRITEIKWWSKDHDSKEMAVLVQGFTFWQQLFSSVWSTKLITLTLRQKLRRICYEENLSCHRYSIKIKRYVAVAIDLGQPRNARYHSSNVENRSHADDQPSGCQVFPFWPSFQYRVEPITHQQIGRICLMNWFNHDFLSDFLLLFNQVKDDCSSPRLDD